MPRPIPEAAIAGLIFAIGALGQSTPPLTLYQSSYQLKPGQSALVPAAPETIQFLQRAAKRELTLNGAKADGLVLSPSRDGTGMVLGASLRAKPGAYTVQLTATDASGVQRAASLSVAVAALTTVPNNATRPPVVLLNGWISGFTNSCPVATSSSETFGNLAQYLVSDGAPVVYLFDNCLEGPNDPIETLAQALGTFLNSITYADGTQVPQIDLVAHSMGGLIVRAYLAGLQAGGSFSPPTPTLVRNLVMIAVPNFGSFVAGTYSIAFPAGSQSAEMAPASSFLWNLATWNQHFDDLRGVNAIAVIGNAGAYVGGLDNSTSLANASDGIVSLTSASLEFVLQGAGTTRIVPYCHVDPSAFINTNLGTYECNAPGIANVINPSHPTGQIVRSFLSGTSAWQSVGTTPATDPYLSVDGGLYFAAVSSENQYLSDVTSAQWGTLPLTNGGDIDTIYYADFIHGTGVFEAASQSEGTLDCGSLAEPLGYYSAARCKVDTAIFSVGPLVTGTNAKLVTSGANITLTGYAFGSSPCSGCGVQATPGGSTTTTKLAIASWSNTSITATLPASFSGFVAIAVIAAGGVDAINIMVVSPSTISVSSSSLQFTYTIGGSAPASQTVQITSSGISWTAAATTTSGGSWLSVSPASGTSPSTLTVSVSPSNLAAGTYSGSITISASGASSSTVSVTLTVAGGQPVLAVGSTALTFTYDYSGAAPAAQTVAISNTGTGTLSWTASDPDFWVALSPASATSAATLTVTVNPANLPAGNLLEHGHHHCRRSHQQSRDRRHLAHRYRRRAHPRHHRRRQHRRLSAPLRLRHLARHLRHESLPNHHHLDRGELRQQPSAHLARRSLRHHRRHPRFRRIRQPRPDQRPRSRRFRARSGNVRESPPPAKPAIPSLSPNSSSRPRSSLSTTEPTSPPSTPPERWPERWLARPICSGPASSLHRPRRAKPSRSTAPASAPPTLPRPPPISTPTPPLSPTPSSSASAA